jgi:hypothetical protein
MGSLNKRSDLYQQKFHSRINFNDVIIDVHQAVTILKPFGAKI